MQDDVDVSDLQNLDDDSNDYSYDEAVESGHYDEPEESEDRGEQGERSDKAQKSSFVDTSKIQDQELRKQIDGRIGELYRQSMEGKKAQAEAKKLQDELEALRSKQELVEVEAPSVDLAIDDPMKFAAQQKAHSEYLAKKYAHDQLAKAKAKQVEEASKQAYNERIANYNKRVAALKIEPEILKAASEQVSAAGVSRDLIEYLLDHEYGPSIVKHLGTNFEDLYEVSKMTPMRAVAYIEKSILPKAAQKRTPSAPPPPTKVKGARNSDHSPVSGWKIS